MFEPQNLHSQDQPLLGSLDPVFSGLLSGPRYGDEVWDFHSIIERESAKERRIVFASVPTSYRRSVRNILSVFANPTNPIIVEAGVVHRENPASPPAVIGAFYKLRTIAHWGRRQELNDFADWAQRDANAFLEALQTGHHNNGLALTAETVRLYVDQLKCIRQFSPVVPRGGFAFLPWGSLSSESVAEVQNHFENETPPLPWETWAPLVRGAWSVVDVFSSDIMKANRAQKSLPIKVRGPGGYTALRILRQWADGVGVLPLHTGFGRTTAPRGEKNVRLLVRMLGINDSPFTEAHRGFRPEAVHLLDEMALDPERSALGGLVRPTVLVENVDGSTSPWISEIGLGETEHLVSVLRGACYVVLAALTGMRDSEIQSLTRDAITTLDGLPALTGRQFKGVPEAQGKNRGWWAPSAVMRAAKVLGELSPHATHLFARSATNVGAYDSTRDVRRLIAFINDSPATRVGRGRGLALQPIYVDAHRPITCRSLRRSFSVFSVTRPGAELGLGIQLGHMGARTTTGYFSDGTQQVTKMMNDDRRTMLRNYTSALVFGAEAVAGPAGSSVRVMRAQVVADPRRAEQLINKLAERLHPGVTNDCMFNASTAACGPNGPFLGDHICAGSDCTNSLYTSKHRRVLESHIDRIDKFLNRGKGNNELIERLRHDRTRIKRLIREMTPSQEIDEADAL